MALAAFDTLKFANRLKSVGVPLAQAEAEAEVLAEIFEVNLRDLAIKEDLQHEIGGLRKDMAGLEERLNTKHESLRKDMDAKHESLRHEIGDLCKDMEAKFDILRAEMSAMKWVLGIVAAANIALLVKTFF